MKIAIDDLYGIKNKLSFQFDKSAILFAPNGVGKTSLTKGFAANNNGYLADDLEGNPVKPSSLKIDGDNITDCTNVTVYTSQDISEILNDPLDVIRGFLKHQDNNAGDIPKNIYDDFINTYSKIAEELEGLGIHFNKIEVETNDITGINEINEIISETKSVSKKVLFEMIESQKEQRELLKILSESKIKDYKTIFSRVKKITKNIYDKELSTDFNIMKLIVQKDRTTQFGYKINDEYKPIDEIYEDIEKQAQENGIPPKDLDAVLALKKVDDMRDANSTTKTSRAQVNFLQQNILELGALIHFQFINHSKKIFADHEKEFKKREKEFIDRYNNYVNLLNKEMLHISKLKWRVKINNINKYHEETSITIIDDGIEREHTDLLSYASEGQKKIIAIILACVSSANSKLIVFDDIVSSLDSDNLDIFKDMLGKINEEPNTHIIMLTHSYNLVSKMAFLKDFKFFGMEDINNKKMVFEFNGINSMFLYKMFNLDTKNQCDKTLFAATVLRETIDNYIKDGYLDKNKSTEEVVEIKDKLLLFKADLEWLYRHYKTNLYTFKSAALYIKENHKEVIDIFNNKLMESLINNESEEVIADYVINFEPNNKFMNLLDYIAQKYLYSLKVRFMFEKNVYNNLSQKFKDGWDKNEIFGMGMDEEVKENINKEKIDIFMTMFSHNHLNNLRWTPIVESPMYKTKMYLDIIKEDNYKIKK